MPQSERPSSPEEHNSDQYNMYRLEHDLYELFEEQQMLLDIVTQQQERLERQLEVQRLLMSEPPARIATPLPELVLEEISAELPVMELPEPEAQSEPDHLDIVEEEVQHLVEQPPALPRSRCICTLPRRPHQVSTSLIQSMAGAKCTPPMLTGLGYDTPFSYPKRMSKGRNRRALFIFSVVDNLVLQLQHGMRLTNNNVCFSLPQRSSVVIREMPKEATTTTSTSAATSTFTSMVPKSKSKPTGALPKPKLKRFEGSTKLKATTAKRLRKRLRKTTLLDQEIDMDCEFGMDHIQKFRLDRVREDSIYNHRRLSGQSNYGLSIVPQTTIERMPLTRDQTDEDELSESLSGLNIFEDVGPQSKQLKLTKISLWHDNALPRPDSQLETRPCTPELQTEELNSYSLLPAVMESNGFIDIMPSTSAQARALALAMHQPGPSSVSSSPLSSRRSSIRQYPEFSPPHTPPTTSLKQLNFTYLRSAESTQSTPMPPATAPPPPPPPPPPSPMLSNSFPFGNSNPLANLAHLPGKEFTQFDACIKDFTAASRSNYH